MANSPFLFAKRAPATRVVAVVACAWLSFGSAHAAAPSNPSQKALADAANRLSKAKGDIASLAAAYAKASHDAQDMQARMGKLRQEVNKALVDYASANKLAKDLSAKVAEAKKQLDATSGQLGKKQKELNELSRSIYKQSAADDLPVVGDEGVKDVLEAQSFLKIQAAKNRAVVDALAKKRVDEANTRSEIAAQARKADQARDAAKAAKDKAESDIAAAQVSLGSARAKLTYLQAEQQAAKVRLEAAKVNETNLKDQAKQYRDYIAARAEQKAQKARYEAAQKSRQQASQALATARHNRKVAEAEAQQAEKTGAPDVQAKKQAAQSAVHAELVARSTADDFDARATQARDFLKQANSAVGMAADAVNLLGDLLGSAGSSNAPAARRATPASEPVSTITRAVTKADTVISDVSKKADAASKLANIVGGAVDEPPAPAGTQAAKIQSQPDQNYSILQLYKGFDTVTPADLGLVTKDSITAFDGTRSEKVEAVIARAKSQLGVPYAWGGGNAAGPTRGIHDGGVADSYGDYNKIGFDCSGLVLYAFAGVGVALPHYTGYQYQRGRKIPINQIQRGDVLYWGPNAEYHTAIYLGNGQMIEAPESGSTVKISPVRYTGMAPYAVRFI